MAEEVSGKMMKPQGNPEDEDNDDVFVECEPVVVHEVQDRSGYRSSGSMDSTSSETSPFGRTNVEFCISSSTTHRSRIRHQTQFLEEQQQQQLEDITANNRDSKFLTEAIHSEKEFFDYLMSLPTVETTTPNPMRCRKPNTPNIAPEHDNSQNDNSDVLTSTSANPKVGLDHLDHLCKLMEQLGDLRKKNVKLQKRVQYLEELRTLNELRKELRDAVQSSLLAHQQPCITTSASTTNSTSKPTTSRSSSDTKQHHSVRIALQEEIGDEQQGEEVSSRVRPSRSRHHVEDTTWYGSDETLLDKDTGPVTTSKGSGKAYSRLRRSIMRRRTRSKSVGNVEIGGRSSDGLKSRISRWTKVREALKWERAQVGHQQPGAAFYVDVSSLQTANSHTPSPNTISLPGVGVGGSGSSPGSSTAGGAGDSGVCLSEDGISTLSQQQQQQHHHQPQPRTSTSPETDLTLISLGLHPMDDGDLLLAKYLEENALLDSSSDESVHGDENDRFEGEAGDQMCSLIDAEDITAVMQRRQSSPLRVYLSREPLVDNEPGRKGKSLDRDVVPRMLAKFAQSEKEKKIHKGAWGRVKNIIQTRKDSLKRKQRKTNTPYETDNADDEDAALDTHARPISAAEAEVEEEDPEDDVQVTSKPKLSTKIKRGRPVPIAINIVSSEALDVPRKTTRGGSSVKKIVDAEGGTTSFAPLDDTVLCSAGAYSPPTHHRKSKWTRMKKALLSKREVEEEGAECRTQSVPSSPTVAVAFSYDDLDLMDDDDVPTMRVRKGSRSNSNLAERSAELERNLAELQRNLSEDFSRKLEEWEHKRCGSKRSSSTTLVSSSSSSGVHQHRAGSPSKSGDRMPAHSTNLKAPSSRKGKCEQRDTKDTKTGKQREKELHWLEKQLQKVEREKQRLAKERQKYMEREARLERLRESVITSSTSAKGGPQEVLVRTAAGEFRFAGISRTFTRKLYEWEEMKGIGPEVSTIALLDPNYRSGGPGGQEHTQDDTDVVKRTMSTLQDTLQPPSSTFGGRLDRNRSRSESSLVDLANVQTSTTSLVGIRGHDDDGDDDYDDDELFRIGDQSRATSEPDISTIGVEVKPWFSPPCAIEVEEMHIEETSPCIEIPEVSVEEPVYSYAPPEVARISTMEVEVVTERAACSERKNGVQESYSSLIDENMELMKKLRDKEEICQKLENDLENIETQSKLQLNQQNQNFDVEGLRSVMHSEGIEMPEGHSAQRENLEKVLRQQRTQQENIAQRLVEKLSELQSTQLINLSLPSQIHVSADKNSLAPPQPLTISPGVHKIQELSGDLCIQAKKLEQALIERNTTIRNLRWELLKRDMNVTQREPPQHKSPPDNSRPLLQRGGTHSRMWSSVDAVLMSNMGKEVKPSPEKPKITAYKALRTVDSVELECLPQQITAKVQDLKDELARLWSSLGMNTGEAEILATLESVAKEEDKGLKENQSTDTEIIVSGKENIKPGLRELTARRVSDTCVTSDQKPTLPEAISLAKPVRKFAPHKPKPLVIDKKPLENAIATDNESSGESANEESAGVTVNLRTVASTKSPQIPTGLRSPSRVPRSLSTPTKPARVTKTTPDASPTAPWRKPRPVAALPDSGPATAPAVLTPAQSPILPWRNRDTQMENMMGKDIGQESPISKSRSARLLKRPAKTVVSGDSISTPVSPPTPPTRSKPAFPKPIRIPGKDPAPNIKLMIEKFNQKVEVAAQDPRKVTKSLSAGSSKSNIPFFTGGVGTKGLKAEDSSEVVIQKSVSFSSALPQQHNVPVPASPNQQRQSRDTVRKSESAASFPTKTASPRTIRAPSFGPPPSPGTLSRIPRPSGPPPLPSPEVTKNTVTVPDVVIAIATKTIPAPPSVPPRDDSNHPANVNRAWQLKKAREEFLSRIPSPSAERKMPLPQTEPEPAQPTVPTRKESLRRAPSDKTRKPKDSDKIAKGILKTWRCSFPKGADADSNEKENQRVNNTGDNNDDEDDEDEKDFSLPSGLLKSASAGMINAETTAAIFKRMSSQLSEASTASTVSGEDLGLTTSTSDRQSQQQPHHHKSGIFGFRFRKCKLKKKDSDPLPVVKALCRQSLFVDLSTSEGQQSQHQQPEARSCPSSPELKTRQRGKASWFSKPKGLFRGK